VVPLTADALDTLLAKDRARLEALTGADFTEPLLAPPLMQGTYHVVAALDQRRPAAV